MEFVCFLLILFSAMSSSLTHIVTGVVFLFVNVHMILFVYITCVGWRKERKKNCLVCGGLRTALGGGPRLSWLASLPASGILLPLPVSQLQKLCCNHRHTISLISCVYSADLNVGPCACTARVLPSEPSP